MAQLLEIQNLNVRYRTADGGDVFAVRDASLRIAGGEIVGVLGESGSGKSTIATSILAIFARNAVIDDGAVLLDKKNLLKLDRRELASIRGRRISLIFQEPGTALHPTMRVGTQIEEVIRAHSQSSKSERELEARATLASIFAEGAERIYSSYPHELSGGQRQRVAIAQAIACKPDLLIADESTASLDTVTQLEILDLLKKLNRERGLAILIITHSLEILNGFAQRVVVMYGGRVVEEGEPARLLGSAKHPYTQALLNCRPSLECAGDFATHSRIPTIPGDPPDPSTREQGCAFEPRCADRMQICREYAPELLDDVSGGKVRCLKFDVTSGAVR